MYGRTQHHEMDRAPGQVIDQLFITMSGDDVGKNRCYPGVDERPRQQTAVVEPKTQLPPSLPDHLACRQVDIVEALRPAMAGDDKTLYMVAIDVGSDGEPFC